MTPSLLHVRLSHFLSRVPSRIYRLGEKSRVAEGHELPREGGGGVRTCSPGTFFK